MMSLWPLIQYDRYPHEKRRLGHRQVQKKDNIKTQGGDGHPQAKERALEDPCQQP